MKLLIQILIIIITITLLVAVNRVAANQECSMADLIRGLHLAKEIVSQPTPTPIVIIISGTPLGNCSMPVAEWFNGGYMLGDSWQIKRLSDQCSDFRCPRLIGTLDKRILLPIGIWCKDSLGYYTIPMSVPKRETNNDELKTICRRCGI